MENYEQEAIVEMIRVKTAEKDIVYFAETYLKHLLRYSTPDFHREIYGLITGEKRLGIAAPRSFAKSTIVQIIYGMWLLLTRQGSDILTISASGTLAEEWVRKIKMELETNELIRNDFSWIRWGAETSNKWTESHITLHNLDDSIFSQMRARGRGCQIRGFRPTNVLADDLEDDELVKSDEQRKKLEGWFLAALINSLDNNQQLIIIGTILHPLSLLKKIIDRKDQFKEWKTRKYQALTDGKSIWEEKWPTEALYKRKAEIGTYAFQSEYQNEPLLGEEQLIRPEWIQKYEELPGNMVKFLVIDPAISTREGADETGMVVLGVSDKKIYEVESVSGRWGVWDIADRVNGLFQKHNPVKIGVEAIAYQQVLKPILIQEGRVKGLYLPIQSITLGSYSSSQKERKEPKDKFTRALGITHLFEQGLVYLKTQKLIDQCLLFPTGDHDDLFDALVYGLHLIMKFSRQAGVFKDKSDYRQPQPNSFEVEDGKEMPCMAPPPGTYPLHSQDWRN